MDLTKHNKKLLWVPAVVTKVLGTPSVNVCVFPREPACTWCRPIDQLHPSYGVEENADPGETPMSPTKSPTPEEGDNAMNKDIRTHQAKQPTCTRKRWNPQLPSDDQYGLHNL